MEILQQTVPQFFALGIFILALIHTFSSKFIHNLARYYPEHKSLFHLLGELEVVFGLWSIVLVLGLILISGLGPSLQYIESLKFTEPLFVFAIMLVTSSYPILYAVEKSVFFLAKLLPTHTQVGQFFLALFFIPLLGSFITEPAAITLASLILLRMDLQKLKNEKFLYLTLGVLFVNVSIGGSLTPFAAPPILMVATTWNWDIWFTLVEFGKRAVPAVLVNALLLSWYFARQLPKLSTHNHQPTHNLKMPFSFIALHFIFLIGIIFSAHYPPIFLSILLLFIGLTTTYQRFHKKIFYREALLVAYFLSGLITLGNFQQWWISSALINLDISYIYTVSTLLSAFVDNAIITYLGSLVPGLSDPIKMALVQGALTGGGLTVIANAANPIGASLLKNIFKDHTISPLYLALAALIPTLITVFFFRAIW
ncbi:MAG: putative Na+/H+ antiporter [Gammaproteobacteria bacterium]|nr:putative Na+/H+ antiporter [Gammaproteobacteria bacterium]